MSRKKAPIGIGQPASPRPEGELAHLAESLLAAEPGHPSIERGEPQAGAELLAWQLPAGERQPGNLASALHSPAAPESSPLPLSQDPELISEFLVEAREHLSNIELRLLEFEQGTASSDSLHSAFRSFHTIKGLAGFLELGVLQEVSHEVETLLDRARNNELAISPPVVDVILAASDYISLWLAHISHQSDGHESNPPHDHSELIRRVRSVAEVAAFALVEAEACNAPVLTASTQLNPPAAGPELPAQGGRAEAREETSVVKVATDKLEHLVDMVGKLVIAESLLHHNPDLANVRTPRVQRDIAHLGRITAEVQKTAMAMRMVPIGQLFRRMTRLVRDLARRSGKKAELVMSGEDVELDRRLVEELSDPLVHMIRNSMDHGIESPAERVAAGKHETGQIRLSAQHQAGEIHIEISDDGRGLNRERILAKSIERGLVRPGEQLTDNEIFQLIFRPGLSTAEKVTEVSGRGVGMDVVWKHLARLRGRVEIRSTVGRGTDFCMRLPLTLAIIDGLVVLCGEERFIVPIFSVREIFRPAADAVFTVQGQGELVLVRERLLPVVRLKRRLALRGGVEDPCQGLLVVGESEGKLFCLLVDALLGKQEVVIKSLGPEFSQVRGLAGGAILGDGRVGLILDLSALMGAGGHGA